MWPYALIFGTQSLIALATAFKPRNRGFEVVSLFVMSLALLILVGLRREIGADWLAYLDMFYLADTSTLLIAMQRSDPAYMLINWITSRVVDEIWLSNLLCAAISIFGLAKFCYSRCTPHIALLAALPYIVIVVMMGYNRQGAAIGLVFLSMCEIERGRLFRFLFYAILAILFHKSAMFVLPLGAFCFSKNRWISVLIIASIAPVIYVYFIAASIERLSYVYLDSQYASRGALVRTAFVALNGLIYLLFLRQHESDVSAARFWSLVSVLGVLAAPASVLFTSSTVVDRLALYLMPLQMVVACDLPARLRPDAARLLAYLFVIISYFILMTVWFMTTDYYYSWVPYKWYLWN